MGSCAELCFGLYSRVRGCEFASPSPAFCSVSTGSAFHGHCATKARAQGSFYSNSALLAVNAQLSFRSSPGIYQLTSSRSWEQPQLSFPPALSTHFLLPYLILQLLSLGAPWAAAASPSVLSVLSAVHAATPQRKQEWKRKKPVAQGCAVSCTWRQWG